MYKKSHSYDSATERWQAVTDRSTEADGYFVYGVMTTGVYCRPSCPSRGAKRENVRFYTLHKDAEKDGLRPCRRCKPTQPSIHQRYSNTIEEACRYIEAQETTVQLKDVAAHVGIAPHHFHRIFKRITGITPKAYDKARRGKRVQHALETHGTVTEAIYASGTQSQSSFQTAVNDTIAMTPKSFKKGGDGETITYGTADSWLGVILVATTKRGVCAIRMGDSDEQVLNELKSLFPKANLVAGEHSFQNVLNETLEFIEKPDGEFTLPLDIQGTVFQQQVWQALQKVPPGETRTYQEIATAIDKPTSMRAVANACGSNPVAVAVPCHRVLRSDGSLGGYRWGSKRKEALLKREKPAG